MDLSVRPEAATLFSYLVGGIEATLLLAFLAAVVSLVLTYIVSACCRCFNLGPAADRMVRVFKNTLYGGAVVTVLATVLREPDLLWWAVSAWLVGIAASVLWAMATTPGVVRQYRQDEAEWQQHQQAYQPTSR